MKRTMGVVGIVACISGLGCGVPSGPETAESTAPAEETAEAAPVILERPFTAEEIRDEWTVGFELRARRWTPDSESFERWRVVYADDAVVDIESTEITTSGDQVGEPAIGRSTWIELRDHASFPAERASRSRRTLATMLGKHEGWLYTVTDPDNGAVSEFFFADACPGAPVMYRTMVDGEELFRFEQVERSRPEEP
jgi:hypothetical protein